MDSTLCDSNTNKQWKLFLANGLSKKNYTLFLCAGIFWRTQSRKNTLLKTLDFWNFTMGMGLFFNPSNLILTFFSFKAVFIWSWPFFFIGRLRPLIIFSLPCRCFYLLCFLCGLLFLLGNRAYRSVYLVVTFLYTLGGKVWDEWWYTRMEWKYKESLNLEMISLWGFWKAWKFEGWVFWYGKRVDC